MKIITSTIFILALFITGCSTSKNISMPNVKITEQFQFTKTTLVLTSSAKTKIVYHTQEELEELLNKRLMYLLKKDNLLSSKDSMNKLVITANYQRAHVGDGTSFVSDALRYPGFAYEIKVMDKEKLLTTIKKSSLVYKGGFIMNLQVIAASLRDKKYEIEFVNEFADKIFDDIKDLQ